MKYITVVMAVACCLHISRIHAEETLAKPAAAAEGTVKVTVTEVPYTGVSKVLGMSKHLDFSRVGDRWYRMCGDHAAIDPNGIRTGSQDGRQEIFSFNALKNDWPADLAHCDQPYYIMDPKQVQFSFPDDTFAVAVENEVWVFPGPTANTLPPIQPKEAAQQIYGKIMAWNPATKLWRVVNGARPRGLPWRGIYDPVKKLVIVPGGGQCAGMNGVVFYRYSSLDGKDVTPCDASGQPIGNPAIPGGVHVAGMAVDWPRRTFYCMDHYNAKLYAVNLDTFDVTLAVDAWPEGKQTGDQGALKLTWHPDIQAVIYNGTKLVIYQPDTKKLTVLPRQDGFMNGEKHFVPTSTIFYDPDTKDIISIGTIDWDTSRNPGHYWRLHFTIEK
jgi:hypothetical protein